MRTHCKGGRGENGVKKAEMREGVFCKQNKVHTAESEYENRANPNVEILCGSGTYGKGHVRMKVRSKFVPKDIQERVQGRLGCSIRYQVSHLSTQ